MGASFGPLVFSRRVGLIDVWDARGGSKQKLHCRVSKESTWALRAVHENDEVFRDRGNMKSVLNC